MKNKAVKKFSLYLPQMYTFFSLVPNSLSSFLKKNNASQG
jgi:hypothetical protein